MKFFLYIKIYKHSEDAKLCYIWKVSAFGSLYLWKLFKEMDH